MTFTRHSSVLPLSKSTSGGPATFELYSAEGFARVPGLFAPGEVAEVREAIDGLFDGYGRLPTGHVYDLDRRSDAGAMGKIPAIRDVLKLIPRLRENPGLQNVLEMAEALAGPGAEVLWDAAIYKPAAASSETPWHQDEAVYHLSRIRKPRSLVYFWVALDAVDESNGCIRFLPGSHLGPLLPHAWRNGDPKSSLVVESAIDDSTAVSVPLESGDATVHHPRILHGSGPNVSDRCRKGWILGVGVPSAPRWLRSLKRSLIGLGGPARG